MPTYTNDTLDAVAKSLVEYSVAQRELALVTEFGGRAAEREAQAKDAQVQCDDLLKRIDRLAGRVA